MRTTPSTESSASSRTYYLKTPYRLVGWGVIAAGLIPGLLLAPAFQNRDRSAAEAGTYIFLLVSSIALFDVLAWVGIKLLRIRLITSPRGIIFYAVGYTLRSSWQNVESLGDVSTSAGSRQGLLLNQPGLDRLGCLGVVSALLPALVILGALRGRSLPGGPIDDRFIPIEPFATDRLFEDLRRYAPQAAPTTAAGASEAIEANAVAPSAGLPPLDRSRPYRQVGWLVGIVVVEIAFVVVVLQGWQGDAPFQTLQVDSWVGGVAFSPNGQSLAVATEASTVQWWRVSDGTLSQTLTLTRALTSFALAPDGQLMAIGTDNGTVSLWRADGTLVRRLNGHTGRVNGVTFSLDGQTVASGSEDGTIRLWRVDDGTLLHILKASPSDSSTEAVTGVAFSPDGQVLAASADSLDNSVQLWRVKDGASLATYAGGTFAHSVAFAPDGQALAAATLDRGIWILRATDGTLLRTLTVPGGLGQFDEWMIAFAPDGQILASVTNGGALQLWRISDGALLRTLRAHTQQVRQVAFSADGRFIATGSFDNTARLWQAPDIAQHP